jgi:hypothetical protein
VEGRESVEFYAEDIFCFSLCTHKEFKRETKELLGEE